MMALGLFELDPNGAAESRYLAFLATAVLLAVAALAPPPAPELAAGTALAVATAWALPAGPARGAAMGLLLVALLAVAAARRLQGLRRLGWDEGLSPAVTVPWALGLQFLLRGGELLSPVFNLHTVVVFLVLPTAGAVAISLLAERYGRWRALGAAGAALALAPGWNVASTLALLALAAGGWIASTEPRARSWWPLAWPFLVAPVLWEPRSGWATALAGLALAFPRAALGLGAVAGAAQLALGSAVPGLAGVTWLVLLVPALAAARRETLLPAMTAILLAAFVPWVPDRAVLAAPLALAALGIGKGWAAAAGRFWAAAVLAGVTLVAGYPWLRADPLAVTLGWMGLAPDSAPALALLATLAAFLPLLAALLLRGLEEIARRSPTLARRVPRLPAFGAAVAAVFVFLALLFHLPRPRVALLPPSSEVRLTADHPRRDAKLPGQLAVLGAHSLVIGSSLANGAALPVGTPVLAVTCKGETKRILRAGIETGEWAARRADVAALGAPLAPSAWMSSIVNGFFSQRYRARLDLLCFEELSVERAPGLPPEVEVVLHAVELEP